MKTIEELTEKLNKVIEKYVDELYLKLFRTNRGAIMYYDDSPYFYFDNLQELEEKLDEVLKEDEFIECPIEFVSNEEQLSLIFEHRHILYYSILNSMWKVDMFDLGKQVKTKIRKEPTPHDKLEVGKWYVKSHPLFENRKENFVLYIGNNEFRYIYDGIEILRLPLDNSRDYHEVVVDE